MKKFLVIGGSATGISAALRARELAPNRDIYAAGDCAETYHCLLNKNLYLPLGTTAHKQGRIAGENAMGGHFEYAGSLGTRFR